jgi:hypothetical protein
MQSGELAGWMRAEMMRDEMMRDEAMLGGGG